MSSAFDSRFAPSRARISSGFGRDCTATYPNGTVVDGFKARRQKVTTTELIQNGRTVTIEICQILVNRDDLAQCVKNMRLKIEDEVWTVEKDTLPTNGGWTLDCSRVKAERRGEKRSTNV